MYGEINQEWHEAKAEHAAVDQKYAQIMEELRCQLQMVNLFSYIQMVNPKLSNEETAEFMHLVFTYSSEAGVDPYEIFAKARVESDFNPTAQGTAGEKGFIQVMPGTFKLYLDKFNYSMDDFENWRYTLRVGIAHYGYLIAKHNGNHHLAETEYNAGGKGNFVERAGYHVRKVVLAKKQVSRFREKGL